MSERMRFSILLPLLSAVVIAIFGGGLGVIFMILFGPVEPHSEEHAEEVGGFIASAGELSVVLLGLAITVGVPVIAYFLQQRFEKQS